MRSSLLVAARPVATTARLRLHHCFFVCLFVCLSDGARDLPLVVSIPI
jgi:hypothetical protein